MPIVLDTPSLTIPPLRTVADLQAHLGGIPANRIRLDPPPGTATVADVVRILDHDNVICELIDGVLVEKTVGYYESYVAVLIGYELVDYLKQHDVGIALGADGTLRILPEQVRAADVTFISWDRFPDGKLPEKPIPPVVPDLAIEVLSRHNTPGEMERKLRDYFEAGVVLVWYIDPATRSAKAYSAVDQFENIAADGTLAGGELLPGFELALAELFAKAEMRREPR